MEKFNAQHSPNKPNQNPNQSVIDQGKLDSTEDVFVVQGETSRSHEINEKRLHKELGSSDRSGKPEKLSEDIRVKHAHDGTGNLLSKKAQAHIVTEQFVPAEHRDTASFNTDNEFNRAINEEDIDFNIPGVPHSAVKRSHGVRRSKFDSEDREPPSSTSTFKAIINNVNNSVLSAKNQKT